MVKVKSKRNDVLKLIALVTMFIDHVGYLIYPHIRTFRVIGRISFPIFAYMIAMGYIHTSSRKNYAKRLFIYGAVIQIVFSSFALLFDPYSANPFEVNVILLLFSGLIILKLYDLMSTTIETFISEKNLLTFLKSILFILIFIGFTLLPRLLEIIYSHIYIEKYHTEFSLLFSYGSYGLILILLFYLFYRKPVLLVSAFLVLSLLSGYISYSVHYTDTSVHDSNIVKVEKSLASIQSLDIPKKAVSDAVYPSKIDALTNRMKTFQWPFFQVLAIMGVLLIILLQNRAFSFTMPKRVAYVFYPAHLIFIYIIKLMFFT